MFSSPGKQLCSLLPIHKRVQESIDKGRQLAVRALHAWKGEVESAHRRGCWYATDINLNGREQSCCRGWERRGRPCEHQCAIPRHSAVDSFGLVHELLTTTTLKATYSAGEPFNPVDTADLQPDCLTMKPSNETKPRGAPRKRRIASMEGDQRRKVVRCGRCHQPGHNQRSCKKLRSHVMIS